MATDAQVSEWIMRQLLQAEWVALSEVKRALLKPEESLQWASRKLRYIRELNRQLQPLCRFPQLTRELEVVLSRAHEAGEADAVRALGADLDTAQVLPTAGESLEALANETVRGFEGAGQQLLRSCLDGYREVITKVAAQMQVGTVSVQTAVQGALAEWFRKGAAAYVDSAGRHWDLASYGEMAARTANIRARNLGYENQVQAAGEDLVIVSAHIGTCPLCYPWQGRILSISGTTPGYPSKADAISAGLFHPNCTHRTSLYIPGLTRPLPNVNEGKNTKAYEARMRLRTLERRARDIHKVFSISPPDEKVRLQERLHEVNVQIRALTKKTGQKRRQWRERPLKARPLILT